MNHVNQLPGLLISEGCMVIAHLAEAAKVRRCGASQCSQLALRSIRRGVSTLLDRHLQPAACDLVLRIDADRGLEKLDFLHHDVPAQEIGRGWPM